MVEWLRHFFDLNSALVFFVYGQVFFVLGLAIATQSRRHSRLELARSLGWLAAFGFLHGLHEWGSFFIPLQADYMSPGFLGWLQIIQLGLLGISFAMLLAFGADLLRDRWPWLTAAPVAALAGWGVLAVLELIRLGAVTGVWHQEMSIWARYFIGLPGALLAAVGLRHQAEVQIRPLKLHRIYRMMRVAGLALVAYGVLGGVIVPAGQFFPAAVLNDSVTVRWLGVPIPVFRSLVGLILTVAIVRALEVFDVELDRLIERMENDHLLAAERERIGRELHDGAIQQVYTAGLIVESARKRLGDEGIAAQRLDRALAALDQAVSGLRSYMHELRPSAPDTTLAERLKSAVKDPRFGALMDVRLEIDLPDDGAFLSWQTDHVLAIAGEALSNAARHGRARHVAVRALREDGRFVLTVEDDGVGFIDAAGSNGFGLRNMRDRARLLGGELAIDSGPGQGTRVKLTVPWEER